MFGFWPLASGQSQRLSCLICSFDKQNLLIVIDLAELDFDNLAAAGGHGLADVGGFNGQLAMSAVDQDGQLYAAGAAVIEEGVEGSANGAAGVEHVVAEDNIATRDVESNCAGSDDWTNVGSGKVVAVKLDIEKAGVDRTLF